LVFDQCGVLEQIVPNKIQNFAENMRARGMLEAMMAVFARLRID
jgi:hypothetical protein